MTNRCIAFEAGLSAEVKDRVASALMKYFLRDGYDVDGSREFYLPDNADIETWCKERDVKPPAKVIVADDNIFAVWFKDDETHREFVDHFAGLN